MVVLAHSSGKDARSGGGLIACIRRARRLYQQDKHLPARHWAMLDLFTDVRGRVPASKEELAQFLDEEHAAGRIPDGPILPTTPAPS